MSHQIDETYDYYDEDERESACPRRCCACQERIAPGHRYCIVRYAFQGDRTKLVRCVRCQRIHEHIRGLDPGVMWPAERLDCGEEYEAHWGESPPPDIAALAFALPGELS